MFSFIQFSLKIFFVPSQATNRPPRDLNTLLLEIRAPKDIEKSVWAKSFQDHLRALNQKENEVLLDFVLMVSVLQSKANDVKMAPQNMKWRVDEINRERRELIILIRNTFFLENSDKPVALGNSLLREELCKALGDIHEQSDEIKIDEVFELIWQARCDYKVWKSGLDRAYILYLSSNPSVMTTLNAVILSII